MDEFIGRTIKFKSSDNREIIGKLMSIKEIEGILVIRDQLDYDKIVELNIDELEDMEIILDTSNVTEEKREDNVVEATNQKEDNVVVSTNEKEDKLQQKKNFNDFIKAEEAYEMLLDAFKSYTPTVDMWLSITTTNIYKILMSVFKCKFDDKIAILINGDNIFASQGYLLGIHLQNNRLSPEIFINNSITSPKNAEIYQRLINSGLKVSNPNRYEYKVVIVCSKSGIIDKRIIKQLSYQHILYTDLPVDSKESNSNYGIVYGVKTDLVSRFNGKVYLVDVGLTDIFLRKYNLRRDYPSTVSVLK